MPAAPRRAALLAFAALTAMNGQATAQTARIHGIVADSLTSTPLAGARVFAHAAGGQLSGSALSDGQGRFALGALHPGVYTVTVERVGYETRRIAGVAADAAREELLSIPLSPAPFVFDPVVVSVSRHPETVLDAPAAVSVVDSGAIEASVPLTPLDPVRTTPGMDFASKGLIQRTFAVRGYRSANSAALLVLADHRFARLPSLGFNVPYLLSTATEDLERIEVTRGPSAALYGPNGYQGVVHLVTRSPFDAPGTTVSAAGGGRSVTNVSLRNAGRVGERVAYRISGEYFRGEDWPSVDPQEVENRRAALAAGADPDTLRIGQREEGADRAAVEGRLDWRPDVQTEVVAAAGIAEAFEVVDITGDVGAIQVLDWRSSFVQARLQRDRLFANAMVNFSDAGDSYQLRTGARVVDQSRAAAVQIQHAATIGGRHRLVYGFDVQHTNPRTAGTIHGRHEDDDRVTETGLYVQETAVLGPSIDVVAALRLDHHDRLADVAVSPRAAVVYRHAPAHAVRLTYNRGFNSPDAADLFVDVAGGSLSPLPFTVRRFGTGEEGFSLDLGCGGPCVYSPFTPDSLGGAGAPLAIESAIWPTLVEVLEEAQVADLSGLPPPQAGEVAGELRLLDPATQGFVPLAPRDLTPLPPYRRTISDVLEVGYRGVIAERVLVGVEVYRNRIRDLLSRIVAATPSLFAEEESLRSYLANFLSADDAAALATAAAGIPLATASSRRLASPDILLVRRQGGDVTLWGADLAVTADLAAGLSAIATYSWVSDDSIAGVPNVGDFILSAPASKGSLSLAYRDPDGSWEGRLQGRAVASFPVDSGVYDGRVESYEVVDLYAAWRLPWQGNLELALDVQNVLDQDHREYVGAPELGRLVVARLRATF